MRVGESEDMLDMNGSSSSSTAVMMLGAEDEDGRGTVRGEEVGFGMYGGRAVASSGFTRAQWLWTMGTIGLASLLVFADQNLLAPNLSAVAKEFGMSGEERDWLLGGVLSALFFAVGAPASIVVGYLADTRHRLTVFLLVLLFGEIPCVLTYFVTSYRGLLATRLFTGMSLGGCIPIVFSLFGDIVPSTQRTLISGGYGVITGGGAGFGQFVAGVTGAWFNWRVCFPLIGIPAIITGMVSTKHNYG